MLKAHLFVVIATSIANSVDQMEINTYFTQIDDVKTIILEKLSKAKNHVYIAMAWFTEPLLFNKLLELCDKGVRVELIITQHEFNLQSPNNYKELNERNGFFSFIGSEEKLMHMKFCVIDSYIVINGSANWTKKAFAHNQEEVTIVSGDPSRAKTFDLEFLRLKSAAGFTVDANKSNDSIPTDILELLDVLKEALRTSDQHQVFVIREKLEGVPDLQSLIEYLDNEDAKSALIAIEDFRKRFTELVPVYDQEKIFLLLQISALSAQIEILEVTKVELETILEQFNHRCIIELSPLLVRILKLKSKIHEKLKKYNFNDDTFKKASESYNNAKQQYEQEKSRPIKPISQEDQKTIKEMYREASSLCHPESNKRVIKDKVEAHEAFIQLNKAYKHNDLEEVRRILDELKIGQKVTGEKEYEIHTLRIKYDRLNKEYELLVSELVEIKMSEEFKEVNNIENWEAYFSAQKKKLKSELNELEQQYLAK